MKFKRKIKFFISLISIVIFIFSSCLWIFKYESYASSAIDPNAIYSEKNITDGFLTDEDGKIAFWTSSDKTAADIVITYKQDINKSLYLATLCTAHRQTSSYLSREISTAASLADINLYLEGRDMYSATIILMTKEKKCQFIKVIQ